MQAGDILFYHGSDAFPDWAVRHFTGDDSGFCHVAVAVSATAMVEAVGRGICQSPLRTPDAVATTGAWLRGAGLQRGLAFLASEVGKRYGWLDILGDAVGVLLPVRTPVLIAPSQFDCSALATEFLLTAGWAALPLKLALDPHRVSPNTLARALGILK